MTTDPSRTALLIIDMQNDTVHPDGAYASFGGVRRSSTRSLHATVRS